MKFRTVLFVAFISILLAACNYTLAEDISPPPGAVQQVPQAQPTQPQPAAAHGPVYPAQAPNPQNGATIYAEKCAGCHGEDGLANTAMSKQLAGQDVTVPALADTEVANSATPLGWYMMVTLGNMDRFMPPFNSLSDQERWDVVAYAQSLSTTTEQISQGESLFAENCADCSTDLFVDQESIIDFSIDSLVSLLADGGEGIPALSDALNTDELQSMALYLRTLSYSTSSAPASSSNSEAPDGTTPGETGQTEGEAEAEAEVTNAGIGPVKGKLVNGSGSDIPSGAEVTLYGFEHTAETSGTPTEVVNKTGKTDKTGAYLFEDVEILNGRIYLVEATYQGTTFQSELIFSDADTTELTVPDLMVYESTPESDGLVVEQLHISFDMAGEEGVQVFELFTISNKSDKAYTFTTDGTSLPFMPLPAGALNVGLELSQDSAPLLATNDGFALPPSADMYTIIAYFNLPYDKELTLNQPFALPVSSSLVIVPEGIKVKSDQLVDEGLQQTQQGANVQMFSSERLNAGDSIEMTLSGKVKSTGNALDNRQMLLIGAGAFGVVLILAGAWMFLRDRNKTDDDEEYEDEDEEDEFETSEEVMDAIIALDDLHRAKKIPDEAYQKRRAELKEILKKFA